MNAADTRILIADDHAVVRRGIRAMLEARGWRVIAETADGQSTVRVAADQQPDIAILDFSMPGLNGLDVTRRLREVSPQTQILIFTMYDADDVAAQVLRAGARAYLLKSDADEHLIGAVEALIARRPCPYTRRPDIEDGSGTRNGLTPREREVVQLIAAGKSNKEVARALTLSVKTVETHRAAAMRKLNASSTADLVRFAIRSGLIVA